MTIGAQREKKISCFLDLRHYAVYLCLSVCTCLEIWSPKVPSLKWWWPTLVCVCEWSLTNTALLNPLNLLFPVGWIKLISTDPKRKKNSKIIVTLFCVVPPPPRLTPSLNRLDLVSLSTLLSLSKSSISQWLGVRSDLVPFVLSEIGLPSQMGPETIACKCFVSIEQEIYVKRKARAGEDKKSSHQEAERQETNDHPFMVIVFPLFSL